MLKKAVALALTHVLNFNNKNLSSGFGLYFSEIKPSMTPINFILIMPGIYLIDKNPCHEADNIESCHEVATLYCQIFYSYYSII